MCQIILFKSIEKVNFFFIIVTAVIVVTVVRTIMQPLHKKYRNLSLKKNFLSTFRKSNLTHLTTNGMFSGQRFAIFAKQIWLRGCVILCVERLRDFVCGEVA